MSVAAVLHPLTAVPQVVKIYTLKQASEFSLLTWATFVAIGVIFLAYAIAHKLKPLILTQVLWFIMDGLILLGIFLYSR